MPYTFHCRRGFRLRCRKSPKPEKGLESRQNPQRRVHALLAGVYGYMVLRMIESVAIG